MNVKKIILTLMSTITALVLAACSDGGKESDNQNEHQEHTNDGSADHSGMNHSGSGEVPEGLKEATNPTYPVGSNATLKTDHMEGMKGAEAEIVGAYDTTVYAVSYNPTNGGKKVENHKWVIHEEMKEAGDQPFEAGDEVTIEAAHMEGMNSAKATIDSAEQTTVYMIDYTPTTGGEKVKNHKWVTGSELSANEGNGGGNAVQ